MSRPNAKLLDELELVVQPTAKARESTTMPIITVPTTDPSITVCYPSITVCTITMPYTVTIAADA